MAVPTIVRAGLLPRPNALHQTSPCSFISNFPSLLSGTCKVALPSSNTATKRASLIAPFCTNLNTQSPITPTSVEAASPSSSFPPTDPIRDAASLLDIRVGCILKAWKHEEAESLYVEEVDVGEAEPRIICSGLVKFIPLEHLQGLKVVVLANLKPRNMRGIKSCGMLLAASDASHENVELLVPFDGSVTGERIWFGAVDDRDNQPEAASPNQIQKKKIWESVQPYLKIDSSGVATLGAHSMRTLAGLVTCRSLKNANIS